MIKLRYPVNIKSIEKIRKNIKFTDVDTCALTCFYYHTLENWCWLFGWRVSCRKRSKRCKMLFTKNELVYTLVATRGNISTLDKTSCKYPNGQSCRRLESDQCLLFNIKIKNNKRCSYCKTLNNRSYI